MNHYKIKHLKHNKEEEIIKTAIPIYNDDSIEHIKYTPLFNFINNANSNLPTSRKLIFI